MEEFINWLGQHLYELILGIIASVIAAAIVFVIKFFINRNKRKSESSQTPQKIKCLISREEFFRNLETLYKNLPFKKARLEHSEGSTGDIESEPFRKLREMVKNKYCLLVIVGGAGGLGKSRLCYELSKKDSSVLFVNWKGYPGIAGSNEKFCKDVTGEDIKNKILVFEDAHEQQALLIDFFQAVKSTVKKVIVTTRYVDELAAELKKHKLHTECKLILRPLTDAAVVLPEKPKWLTPDIRTRLGKVSAGVPQLAVEAYRYLERECKEGKSPGKSLNTIHTAFDLLSTLANDIRDRIGEPNEDFISLLALIRTVPIDHKLARGHFKILRHMQDLGYLQPVENIYRFNPDILADYITLNAFFPGNHLDPKYEKLIRTMPPEFIPSVLRTLSILEMERETSFFEKVIYDTLKWCRARKDINAAQRVDIGLEAFSLFENFRRIETNFGPFWSQGKKLRDPDRLNNLAEFLHKAGYWDDAKFFLKKALRVYRKVKDQIGVAGAFNNLGLVYQDKGEWDRAIEFYNKSLETFEKLRDRHGMAKTRGNLGMVYQDKGEWDRAIEFYNKSLETFEKLRDRHGMALTFNNLGMVYQDKGEWDRAIEFYNKSLETKEKLGDRHGMALTWINLGNLLFEKGQEKEGIQLVDMAVLVLHQIGDIQNENICRNIMSGFIEKLGGERFNELLEEVRQEYKKHSG